MGQETLYGGGVCLQNIFKVKLQSGELVWAFTTSCCPSNAIRIGGAIPHSVGKLPVFLKLLLFNLKRLRFGNSFWQ